MGAVYEAIHPGLKKRVAVKVLLPRIAESHEARVRFLREGEAASRINHPHVVSVFDVGAGGQRRIRRSERAKSPPSWHAQICVPSHGLRGRARRANLARL